MEDVADSLEFQKNLRRKQKNLQRCKHPQLYFNSLLLYSFMVRNLPLIAGISTTKIIKTVRGLTAVCLNRFYSGTEIKMCNLNIRDF